MAVLQMKLILKEESELEGEKEFKGKNWINQFKERKKLEKEIQDPQEILHLSLSNLSIEQLQKCMEDMQYSAIVLKNSNGLSSKDLSLWSVKAFKMDSYETGAIQSRGELKGLSLLLFFF